MRGSGGSHPGSSYNSLLQCPFCRARFWRGCTHAASASLPQPKPVWGPLQLHPKPCWSRARRIPAQLSGPRHHTAVPEGRGRRRRPRGGRREPEGGSGRFSNCLRSLEPLLPCWASPNLSLLWQIQFAIEKCAFCASEVVLILPSALSSLLPGSPGGFLAGWAGSAWAASGRPARVRVLQAARPKGLHRRCLVSASHGAHLPWSVLG